jgi:hypothetical protein
MPLGLSFLPFGQSRLPFGLSLSKPSLALRQAQRERMGRNAGPSVSEFLEQPFGLNLCLFGRCLQPFGQCLQPFGLSLQPFGQFRLPFGLRPLPFGLSLLPFGLSLSKPALALRQAQRERMGRQAGPSVREFLEQPFALRLLPFGLSLPPFALRQPPFGLRPLPFGLRLLPFGLSLSKPAHALPHPQRERSVARAGPPHGHARGRQHPSADDRPPHRRRRHLHRHAAA